METMKCKVYVVEWNIDFFTWQKKTIVYVDEYDLGIDLYTGEVRLSYNDWYSPIFISVIDIPKEVVMKFLDLHKKEIEYKNLKEDMLNEIKKIKDTITSLQ